MLAGPFETVPLVPLDPLADDLPPTNTVPKSTVRSSFAPTPTGIFFEYSISTSTGFPMSLPRRNSFASAPYGSPARSRAGGRGARIDERVTRRSAPPSSLTIKQSPEIISTTVPWNFAWF